MHRAHHIFIIILGLALLSSGTLDLNDLFNYADQMKPDYILKDNTISNHITDEGATLGRVLFYDKNLSTDKTVSCASCHLQEFAFSDTSTVSKGVNGVTGRHSMRLVNARFGHELNFFWDERASTLEEQATMPIRDHGEMGFSGENGDPSFDDLIDRLEGIDYYDKLFTLAFGDNEITESRIQLAIAQFVRSIQSFDSKFDDGRAQVDTDITPFPNFTPSENRGKNLFITPPQFDSRGVRIGGGVGCAGCHRPPEFDIDPSSGNNGVVVKALQQPPDYDAIVTRSPALRDLINPNGDPNGPFMHSGNFPSLISVIEHYNNIPDPRLLPPDIRDFTDNRLTPGGNPQRLNLTDQEKQNLIDFLHTLSGQDIYTNEKWSNPFDSLGQLVIIDISTSTVSIEESEILVAPNPTYGPVRIESEKDFNRYVIYSIHGQMIQHGRLISNQMDISDLPPNVYLLLLFDENGQVSEAIRLIRN